ncbi:MAG: UDP-4-amino-4,6-dideoxy-N-acetyl-beta-L-altrosamine transaminase [Myxococcota bacterium]
MSDMIPYGAQWLDEEDIAAVVEVLRGAWLTTGPTVASFEAALAEACGVPHAIAVNSGTAALHVAYHAAGLGPGDELITTPLTFAATANAALYLGATVRFVDVCADTGNIDPDLVRGAVSDTTRVLAPVDYAGHPADYDALRPIAEASGLTIVADAAHSLGARYHGRPVGTLADLTALSLHPIKPITTGEGGAVVTADSGAAEVARSFRSHGFVRDPERMKHRDEGPWYAEQHALGFNYRLTDIQAGLGLSQIAKLARFITRRQEIACHYFGALADLKGITIPTVREGVESGWHLFTIRVPEARFRRPLFTRLRELGLGVQVHYLPVYRHPYYEALGYDAGLCPVAEDLYARSITIPLFPRMTDEMVKRVVEGVHHAVSDVLP